MSPDEGAPSPHTKSGSKGCLVIIALILVGFGIFVVKVYRYDPDIVASVRVEEGYDANRFELRHKRILETIGVGIPPTKETRDLARDVVQKLIEGKHIRIETDIDVQSEKKSLLAYVHVKVRGGQPGLENVLNDLGLPTGKVRLNAQGEVFINELLIRLGLAPSKPEAPNLRHRARLEAAQAAAKQDALGMWQSDPSGQPSPSP